MQTTNCMNLKISKFGPLFSKFIFSFFLIFQLLCCFADVYPSRPIKLVIPYPPGNASDVTARALGDILSKQIGQPVIVDNKPGAGGIVGTDFVVKSNPDGYNLLITSLSPIVISPHISKNLPFDSLKDLIPVSKIGYTSMILVSSNTLPVNNIQELLTYAKNNPNKLSYASVGSGTLSMLTMEVFKKSTQVDILHVPYKGSSQAMTDLISGNVSLMFDGMTSSYIHVKTGKLKALAIASSSRSDLASDIPTLKESGNPNLIDFRVEGWTGLFAAPNTPVAITRLLNQEINKVILDPEFKRRAQTQNFEVYPASTPEQFSSFVKADFDRWGSVIKPLNISDN